MARECDHDIVRVAAGVPSDWAQRLADARATIVRLGRPTDFEGRVELARARRDEIHVLVALAALELRAGAPDAEEAFVALDDVRAGDDAVELRRCACESLLRLGQARRTLPGNVTEKTNRQLAAVNEAIALASRSPVIEDLVVAGLTDVIRAGKYQTDATLRSGAFDAGRLVVDRFLSSPDMDVAHMVVRAIEELTSMMQLDDPEAMMAYDKLWTAYAPRDVEHQRVAASALLRRATRLRLRKPALALACIEQLESLGTSLDPEIQKSLADARALRSALKITP